MAKPVSQRELIAGYSRVRMDLERAIIEFPHEARDQVIFGDWSIVQLMAHVSGWDSYTLEALNLKMQSEEPIWGGDEEEVNARSLEIRRGSSWNALVIELMMTRIDVKGAYERVPEELWLQLIWSDHPEITPERSIRDDTEHYQAHLLEIIKVQEAIEANK